MNDLDIFVKTPAGFEEVRGRGLKLAQRLRTMLIMVDGSRSLAQLRDAAQTLSAPADFLEVLLSHGLIAPDGATAARTAANTPAHAAATEGTEFIELPVAPLQVAVSTSPEKFRAALKFMNDSAVDLLGLRAFFFTLKLEKCYTAQDLLALLPDFSKAIAKSNGVEMARALEERARQLLSD